MSQYYRGINCFFDPKPAGGGQRPQRSVPRGSRAPADRSAAAHAVRKHDLRRSRTARSSLADPEAFGFDLVADLLLFAGQVVAIK